MRSKNKSMFFTLIKYFQIWISISYLITGTWMLMAAPKVTAAKVTEPPAAFEEGPDRAPRPSLSLGEREVQAAGN